MGKRYGLKTERMHLFTPNVNVVTKVKINGHIEKSVLDQAMNQVVDANEILRSKIIIENDGQAYYQVLSHNHIKIRQSDVSWKDLMDREKEIAFDLEAGELIRVFYSFENQATEVVLITHHLAADGLSCQMIVDQLLQALNGRQLDQSSINIIDSSEFPPDTKLPIATRLYAAYINKKWQKRGRVFNYKDYKTLFKGYWDTHKTCVLIEEIEANLVEQLRGYCKKNQVTVNSAVTTAYLKACGHQADFGMAVSVRCKSHAGLGNYASGIGLTMTYDYDKSFAVNCQMVHKAIYKKLGNPANKYYVLKFFDAIEQTLMDAVMMVAFTGYSQKTANYLSKLMGYSGKKIDFGISNLGRLNTSGNKGPYEIQDYVFVPPIIPNNKRVIGVATLNGRLTMAMHVQDQGFMDAEETFIKNARHTLEHINEL